MFRNRSIMNISQHLVLISWMELIILLKIKMSKLRYGIQQVKRDSRLSRNLSTKKLMAWSLLSMLPIQEVLITLPNGSKPPTNMLTKKYQKFLWETSVISQTKEKLVRNKPNQPLINSDANIMMLVLKWTRIFKNAWMIFLNSLLILNMEKPRLSQKRGNRVLKWSRLIRAKERRKRVAPVDKN